MYAVTTVNVVSALKSLSCCNTFSAKIAVSKPIAAPPIAMEKNWITAWDIENAPNRIAARLKRYKIRAVASLTRLSPSSKTINRLGTPSFFTMEVAADASVGDTIAPNRNASLQVKSGNKYFTARATVKVVNITRPMASCEMGLRLNLKSLQEEK